jgi:hypothetical protein
MPISYSSSRTSPESRSWPIPRIIPFPLHTHLPPRQLPPVLCPLSPASPTCRAAETPPGVNERSSWREEGRAEGRVEGRVGLSGDAPRAECDVLLIKTFSRAKRGPRVLGSYSFSRLFQRCDRRSRLECASEL